LEKIFANILSKIIDILPEKHENSEFEPNSADSHFQRFCENDARNFAFLDLEILRVVSFVMFFLCSITLSYAQNHVNCSPKSPTFLKILTATFAEFQYNNSRIFFLLISRI
jgi:hypothetical protein